MKSNPLPASQPASQSTNRTKMFCKVCKDAKKSESVYTSHSVRDETGKVVCPTLLSQECKYCKEKGHTPKYCPKPKLVEEVGNPNPKPLHRGMYRRICSGCGEECYAFCDTLYCEGTPSPDPFQNVYPPFQTYSWRID